MIPAGVLTRKTTCNCCRKRRLCGRVDKWWWYCSECYELSREERSEKSRSVSASKPRIKRPRFAYPCVGGPLDGEYATSDDFDREFGAPGQTFYREGGMYAHLCDEYVSYNGSVGRAKKIGTFPPSMIFVHRSVLKPLGRPADR